MYFESIKIRNKNIVNLALHNARINNTIKYNFNINSNIDLSEHISPYVSFDIIKCRVLYKEDIKSITYTKYIKKKPQSFMIINDNKIRYKYKSNNRNYIDRLYSLRCDCDDIIIIKDNLVTDTSIANIAILYDNEWLTPRKPLLNGIMRSKLIQKGFLKPVDIDINMVKKSTSIAVMNAMVGFYLINDFDIKGL